MRIVRLLGSRHSGFTRKEIAEKTGLNPNGDFSKMLKALIGSDFVVKYVPFGMSKREEHYKLIDSFCWFWLHFKEGKKIGQEDYWQRHLKESDVIPTICLGGERWRRNGGYADRPSHRTCR